MFLSKSKLYALPIKGSRNGDKNITEIFRHIDFMESLVDARDFNLANALELIKKSVAANPNRSCMGTRNGNAYQFMTYSEAHQKMLHFAKGLRKLQLVPDKNSQGLRLLGLYLVNCPEWVVAQYASYYQSITVMPLYDTFGQDALQYVFELSEMETIVTTSDKFLKVLEFESIFNLKNVILVDGLTESSLVSKSRHSHLRTFSFADIVEQGRENPDVKIKEPSSDDIAILCFTSGTTGLPKGAMLTHNAICSSAMGAIQSGIDINAGDYYLSYLPLSHMYELNVQLVLYTLGAAVGFYSGDLTAIRQDIQALRPTIFTGVPRVYTKLLDAIKNQVAQKSAVIRALFNYSVASKKFWLHKRGFYKHVIWDTVTFKKVKKTLGLDRLKYALTGSAPMTESVMQEMRCILGVPIIEGYGQTETVACSTLMALDDWKTMHIGGPLPHNQIRLRSVPEMGCSVDETEYEIEEGVKFPILGRGELEVFGSNLFVGYFKQPELTAEVLSKDGWIRSGDICVLLPSGAVKIVDRKKDIFKLSQGEYVTPSKLENLYSTSSYLQNIFVHGDSRHSYLVAICVLDVDWINRNFYNLKNSKKSEAEIAVDAVLKKVIFDDLETIAEHHKLFSFERVKEIVLSTEVWSLENGLLTSTNKFARNVAKTYYKKILDNLYTDENRTRILSAHESRNKRSSKD